MMEMIFPTSTYLSQANKLRAQFVYILATLSLLGIVIVVYLEPIDGVIQILQVIQQGRIMDLWWAHAMIVVVAITYGLLRRGRLNEASWVLVLGLFSVHALINATTAYDRPIDFVLLPILLLASGLLLDRRQFLITAVIIVSVYSTVIVWNAERLVQGFSLFDYLMASVGLLIFSIIVYAFQRIINVSRMEGELVAGQERFKLAEINTAITRQASDRAGIEKTLNTTLAMILSDYPQIYHAQVFLIDEEGVFARLVASTGVAGKTLLERGHKLAVGSVSVIGQVTFRGELMIVNAGDAANVHRRNELLPDTRLEAAFPLRIGAKIIGALDLQSRELITLTEYDRYTFQSIADSLSLAIDNIRQFEATRVRVEENQRLAEQARAALREVERLNQRLIGRAWSEYIQNRSAEVGLNIDFENDRTEVDTSWTDALATAAQSNSLVQDERLIALPLRLRGQVIGAIEVELSEDYDFTGEDLELLQEVSERFGIAAENTRLIEESQRTAQRETLINEISSRLQTATNVEATLAEAARSMTETLQANRVMIRLGAPAERPRTASVNGRKE